MWNLGGVYVHMGMRGRYKEVLNGDVYILL